MDTPGTTPWADKLAVDLARLGPEAIALALLKAYNEGLGQAREVCERAIADCKSFHATSCVQDVSTECLHMMVLDGETNEPLKF